MKRTVYAFRSEAVKAYGRQCSRNRNSGDEAVLRAVYPAEFTTSVATQLAHDFGDARQHINIVVPAEVADQFLDAVVGVDPGTRSASRNSQAAAA
ncbi:hypothetical protein MTX26_31080 [Bradyrhizobium sp. ISRA443]|uniref:hypothetical protein n=1 Tax=unclassified Bradyrhizobium TaxID=2631580 RepID=UPI0024789F2E|nr:MULTISPECIES: hypothetical protein [unclassified Bradyrhizobium]WGR93986.1 hypothetical protein MTX20_06095 [Bradyrhizobium sp. ISRA435]WGR98613.1 hypothetical protein MTX23_31060 [Bradyrhizobium sp. ISRA436]WGS05502.1 hypothetical protein MTX18_31080 [Bradyrhizobium sp. ISRA437]WGS12389.1 hypothetical protein MTX26_31080 [Bradyrhizobium sp. ISRA443]